MTDDELMRRAEEYMDATSRRWRERDPAAWGVGGYDKSPLARYAFGRLPPTPLAAHRATHDSPTGTQANDEVW